MKKAIFEFYKFIGSFIMPFSILAMLCCLILAIFVRPDALNKNAISFIFVVAFALFLIKLCLDWILNKFED
ncbi:hypothetical protein JW977_01285 [Candidatus Falkowbacteria bacterium]|nr:hypothetical protein [Candidatus Falkowbacteria bacterium]